MLRESMPSKGTCAPVNERGGDPFRQFSLVLRLRTIRLVLARDARLAVTAMVWR
jgi:hypothetical protein